MALGVKSIPVNTGDSRDMGSIPGLGRPPEVGNGNPLQYSCLENSMDRGAWRATVHGVAKSQTWLSAHNCFIICVTFCYETWISHMDTYIPFLLSLPPNPKTHPSRSSQQSLVNQIERGIWLSFIFGWWVKKAEEGGVTRAYVYVRICVSPTTPATAFSPLDSKPH